MQVAEIELVYKSSIPASERPKIKSSWDAYEILRDLFPEMQHRERMVMLLLDRRSKVLGSYVVSIGGVAGTMCDPKIVFQACLKANASGFIVAHNHPSGELSPSDSDINLTNKLGQGGKILEIKLLDHLIITDNNFYSLADEGLI